MASRRDLLAAEEGLLFARRQTTSYRTISRQPRLVTPPAPLVTGGQTLLAVTPATTEQATRTLAATESATKTRHLNQPRTHDSSGISSSSNNSSDANYPTISQPNLRRHHTFTYTGNGTGSSLVTSPVSSSGSGSGSSPLSQPHHQHQQQQHHHSTWDDYDEDQRWNFQILEDVKIWAVILDGSRFEGAGGECTSFPGQSLNRFRYRLEWKRWWKLPTRTAEVHDCEVGPWGVRQQQQQPRRRCSMNWSAGGGGIRGQGCSENRCQSQDQGMETESRRGYGLYLWWNEVFGWDVMDVVTKIGSGFFLGLVPGIGVAVSLLFSYANVYTPLRKLRLTKKQQISLARTLTAYLILELLLAILFPIGCLLRLYFRGNFKMVNIAREYVVKHADECTRAYNHCHPSRDGSLLRSGSMGSSSSASASLTHSQLVSPVPGLQRSSSNSSKEPNSGAGAEQRQEQKAEQQQGPSRGYLTPKDTHVVQMEPILPGLATATATTPTPITHQPVLLGPAPLPPPPPLQDNSDPGISKAITDNAIQSFNFPESKAFTSHGQTPIQSDSLRPPPPSPPPHPPLRRPPPQQQQRRQPPPRLPPPPPPPPLLRRVTSKAQLRGQQQHQHPHQQADASRQSEVRMHLSEARLALLTGTTHQEQQQQEQQKILQQRQQRLLQQQQQQRQHLLHLQQQQHPLIPSQQQQQQHLVPTQEHPPRPAGILRKSRSTQGLRQHPQHHHHHQVQFLQQQDQRRRLYFASTKPLVPKEPILRLGFSPVQAAFDLPPSTTLQIGGGEKKALHPGQSPTFRHRAASDTHIVYSHATTVDEQYQPQRQQQRGQDEPSVHFLDGIPVDVCGKVELEHEHIPSIAKSRHHHHHYHLQRPGSEQDARKTSRKPLSATNVSVKAHFAQDFTSESSLSSYSSALTMSSSSDTPATDEVHINPTTTATTTNAMAFNNGLQATRSIPSKKLSSDTYFESQTSEEGLWLKPRKAQRFIAPPSHDRQTGQAVAAAAAAAVVVGLSAVAKGKLKKKEEDEEEVVVDCRVKANRLLQHLEGDVWVKKVVHRQLLEDGEEDYEDYIDMDEDEDEDEETGSEYSSEEEYTNTPT